MKKSVDNIIFLSNTIRMNAGGPCGYLANLKTGLQQINNDNIVMIYYNKSQKYRQNIRKLCKILTFWIFVPKTRHAIQRKLYSLFSVEDKNRYDTNAPLYKCLVRQLDKYNFKTITCHTCKDVLNIKKYLTSRGLTDVKLLQMEHSPSFESFEIYNLLNDNGDPKADEIAKKWRIFEKSAFLTSDILIAPAPEALDSYRADAKWFDDMFKTKEIKYVPTGCAPLKSDSTKEEIRRKYGIKTKYVVCYIGRHLPVRGYETLKNVGIEILNKRSDVTFLIAGNQEAAYPAPKHERWIEAGYSKTADILKASDLMVLANKTAYFDLILLEPMSMGTPVVVSNVNGNKAVYRQTNVAIEKFETEAELGNKINQILDMPTADRQKMSDNILSAYEHNYTLPIFAKNYVNMIQEILDETKK